MFTPFDLAMIRPKGIEPARNAMTGGIQRGMFVMGWKRRQRHARLRISKTQ